jgi:prepilin-type N-terminal cleavage/methylation domain-containing protein
MNMAAKTQRLAGSTTRRSVRRGFTLVEMMIAVAVTLLMMVALAEVFSRLGRSLKASRAEVELSQLSRDIAQPLRDQLRRCTVDLSAPTDRLKSEGYLTYFDGPWTDATGMPITVPTDGQAPFSKYGDFDDYIAFTAYAGEGSFTGKVPAYLVDPSQDPLVNTSGSADPLRPVVVSSKYAEIIYWIGPEYVTTTVGSATTFTLRPETGLPFFRDVLDASTTGIDPTPGVAGDGIPDRMVLHRRILLIRPDLNTELTTVGTTTGVPVLPSRSLPRPSDGVFFDTAIIPGATGGDLADEDWLTGMSRVHQLFDISLRRVIDPVTGARTNRVACNSLSDLSYPHNRFAHVRMPGAFFGATNDINSMPFLALGETMPGLRFAAAAGLTNHVANQTWSPGIVDPNFPIFNGFLLPHFELSNAAEVLFENPAWDRRGEDVLLSGVLGMDVRGFDADAPLVIQSGSDQLPGRAGIDDNGNGDVDDVLELGSAGSDDQLVTPADPGYAAAVRLPLLGAGYPVPAPLNSQRVVERGAYVDMDWALKPGGSVRGVFNPGSTLGLVTPPYEAPNTYSNAQNEQLLQGQLSGLSMAAAAGVYPSFPNQFFTPSLFRSGRCLATSGGELVFYQPAFDTFTDGYEYDGFDQGTFPGLVGTIWRVNSAGGVPLGAGSDGIDLGRDGFDSPPFDAAAGATANGLVDDLAEQETTAPVIGRLRGLQVRLRIEDPDTRQVKQSTVEFDAVDR